MHFLNLFLLLISFHQAASVINAGEWEEWKSRGFLLKLLARNQPENVIACTATLVSTSIVLAHPRCIKNATSGERYAQIAISLPNFSDYGTQKWSTAKVLEVNEAEAWALLRFVPQNIDYVCPMNSTHKWVVPLNYPQEPNINGTSTYQVQSAAATLLLEGILTNKCFMLGFETSPHPNAFQRITKKIGTVFLKHSTLFNGQSPNITLDLNKADNASGCFEDIGAPLLCKHANGITYQVGMLQNLLTAAAGNTNEQPQGETSTMPSSLQACSTSMGIRFVLLPSNIFDIIKKFGHRETTHVYEACQFGNNFDVGIGEQEAKAMPDVLGPKTEAVENGIEAANDAADGENAIVSGVKTSKSMISNEPCGVILESKKRKREAGQEHSFRIEHGQQTPDGDYPFIVYVATRCNAGGKMKMLQHCTGSIIQRRWILTAAHCAAMNASQLVKFSCNDVAISQATMDGLEAETKKEMTFSFASQNIFISLGTKLDTHPNWHSVKRIVRHEFYKSTDKEYDIALLQLSTPLQFGPTINRICLSSAFEPTTGDTATIMGFGITKGPIENKQTKNEDTIHLREDLIRFTIASCPAGFFCQNHPQRKTTHGDSGGPIVRTRTHYGTWYQIALVRGHEKENLNLFTRVGPFCNWIKINTNQEVQCGAM